MIFFFTTKTLPQAYKKKLAMIKTNPTDEDTILVTTISEPTDHVTRIQEWLKDELPHYPYYRGLFTMSVIPEHLAARLKLSLPL